VRGNLAAASLLVAALAAGCGGGQRHGAATDDGPPLPWPRTFLSAPSAPADNPTTDAKVRLGNDLFYDPILSSDRQVACATCHSEVWGLSDGLPVSIGVDGTGPTGPGRSGPNKTLRNAPTLWDVAYRKDLFWDGRAHSLEDQIKTPLTDAVEMDRVPAELVKDLEAIPEYMSMFKAAFPDDAAPVTLQNMERAIGAFERTFITSRATYDRYAAGDTGALNDESVRGMFLFGEAKCSSCHVPPLFASDTYADRGVSPGSTDAGLFDVTGDPADRGKFRVPTLRNLRETGPYFHDGSVASLEDAVAREAARSAAEGQSRTLGADEIQAIATFLDKGLVDLTNQPSRPTTVPSGLQVPVDGFRIPR
jgi:cytochrome c peroxidase